MLQFLRLLKFWAFSSDELMMPYAIELEAYSEQNLHIRANLSTFLDLALHAMERLRLSFDVIPIYPCYTSYYGPSVILEHLCCHTFHAQQLL